MSKNICASIFRFFLNANETVNKLFHVVKVSPPVKQSFMLLNPKHLYIPLPQIVCLSCVKGMLENQKSTFFHINPKGN